MGEKVIECAEPVAKTLLSEKGVELMSSLTDLKPLTEDHTCSRDVVDNVDVVVPVVVRKVSEDRTSGEVKETCKHTNALKIMLHVTTHSVIEGSHVETVLLCLGSFEKS